MLGFAARPPAAAIFYDDSIIFLLAGFSFSVWPERTSAVSGAAPDNPFVLRCMEESTALSLFDGINQETVFTSIDFTNHTYGQQPEFETTYFQEYLSKAKEYGLAVYLLEYKADCALSKRIDAYCEENGFLWYNADSLELC